ncbi:hypothetical protein SAMD00019534_071370 [Acytostelium subglobosum LB1]|uniref:hypothetical protein n=1 Tax=Acytostelium subglobosum LB1 TaxID=1410327 RepID=UPI000644B42A|nr:hypothetical protein SAMD00019534_071370 [Acytostelium subglobosum LB1]GAM23962.1 hypothetical protein SAMD00019534_071370 [Acytostelium subglobosum LB1]|eukprot:XP_012752998.1 hypothetical protein SAMD00019534_071370 [Acytostelium subglobosum LB1]
MKSSLLLLLSLICILSYAYSPEDEPGGIPIQIQVLLIGFQQDGAFEYTLDPTRLNDLLQESHYKHNSYSIETSIYHLLNYNNDIHGAPKVHNPVSLSTHYDITYNVKKLPKQSLERYERLMLSQFMDALVPVDGETDWLSIEPFEPYFENEIKTYGISATQTDTPVYTVFFVNPSKIRMLHDDNRKYIYTLNHQICGPAWIGAGRYLVVDLSAGPLKYGTTLHKSTMEKISEGSVDYDSLPRLVEYFQKDGYAGTSLQGASPIEIEAHMASLVISAVQHVILPDSKYNLIPLYQKVLIPILIFRDHNDYDPLDPGHETSIEIDLIKKEGRRLFPFAEVTVVTGSHSLHEHKHISMALSKSIRTHSSFELNPNTTRFETSSKTYIDSEELLLKLRNEDDILASGLVQDDFLNSVPNALNKKGNLRTKILPVYVFSLKNTDSNILLDKYYLSVANQQAVAVLQSSKAFAGNHYQGSKLVSFFPHSVTRYIISGLAQSQGLMGPTLRYSAPHNSLKNNYLWSYGQHPFGFIGNGTEISQIFIDAIVRNTIITNVQSSATSLKKSLSKISIFSEKYLLDSLGYDIDLMPTPGNLIDRLYHTAPNIVEAIDLLQTLTSNELLLKKAQKDEVALKIVLLTTKVNAFSEYVTQEINKAESQLMCCTISTVNKTEGRSSYRMIMLVVALSAVAALGLFIAWVSSRANIKLK